MSFTIYTCPECGCTVHAAQDTRIVCPDCQDKVVCSPTAIEYPIDNQPAAGPWQFDEPIVCGLYLVQMMRFGRKAYGAAILNASGKWHLDNGATPFPMLAWAKLQEVPHGRN